MVAQSWHVQHYRAGEKLYCKYVRKKQDYTKKQGVNTPFCPNWGKS